MKHGKCDHPECNAARESGKELSKKLVDTCLAHFGVKADDEITEDSAIIAAISAAALLSTMGHAARINPGAMIDLALKAAAEACGARVVRASEMGLGPDDDGSAYSSTRYGFTGRGTKH